MNTEEIQQVLDCTQEQAEQIQRIALDVAVSGGPQDGSRCLVNALLRQNTTPLSNLNFVDSLGEAGEAPIFGTSD